MIDFETGEITIYGLKISPDMEFKDFKGCDRRLIHINQINETSGVINIIPNIERNGITANMEVWFFPSGKREILISLDPDTYADASIAGAQWLSGDEKLKKKRGKFRIKMDKDYYALRLAYA